MLIEKKDVNLKNYMEDETFDAKIQSLLTKDINTSYTVRVSTEKSTVVDDLEWGKSLDFFPVFTRREIDNHVKNCGKQKGNSRYKIQR